MQRPGRLLHLQGGHGSSEGFRVCRVIKAQTRGLSRCPAHRGCTVDRSQGIKLNMTYFLMHNAHTNAQRTALIYLYETSATHAVTDPKQQQSARPVHVADATRCAIDRAGQLLHWQQPGEGRQAVAGHQSIWTARRRAWTEHPDRSSPSSADGHCVGRLQPLLICGTQQSMAVMAWHRRRSRVDVDGAP